MPCTRSTETRDHKVRLDHKVQQVRREWPDLTVQAAPPVFRAHKAQLVKPEWLDRRDQQERWVLTARSDPPELQGPPGQREHRAKQAHRAKLARRAKLGRRDQPGNRGRPAQPESQGRPERRGQRVRWDQPVPRESREFKDPSAPRARQDSKVRPGRPAPSVRKEKSGLRGLQGHREVWVPRAWPVRPAPKVCRGRLGPRDLPGRMGPTASRARLDPRVRTANPARLDPQGCQGPRAFRALPVIQDHRGHPAPPGSAAVLDQKGHPARPVRRVKSDFRGRKAIPDPKDRPVPMEQRARSARSDRRGRKDQ